LDVESSNHIIDLFYRKNKGVAKMKKHLTDGEIKRIFTDPYSLKRGMKLWKGAEKRGEKFIRHVKEEKKKLLEKLTKSI